MNRQNGRNQTDLDSAAASGNPIPSLQSGDRSLDDAFRIAMGDIHGNIMMYRDGLLNDERPCLMAGLDYDTPWTRDAAINVWNAALLLPREVCRDTLLSVLERVDGKITIGGQYWDAIIWVVGAWEWYLVSGDMGFLEIAYEATRNSLDVLERTELDERTGLFRGPAVYGDGVAAYPDRYVPQPDQSSGILAWPDANPAARTADGYGIPMHALSTNCVYARAYELAARIAEELRTAPNPSWRANAATLCERIDEWFWDASRRSYRYLVDEAGGCDRQEGMGLAFAIMFGIADRGRAAAVCEGAHLTPAGMPCVWPTYERYATGDSVGRHSGTVWPHIQGFWADACARTGRYDLAFAEMRRLAHSVSRDAHFAEIYHPVTGLPYGGLQESGDEGIREWASCRRQTWSATAYLRMVLGVVFGAHITPAGITFTPALPPGADRMIVDGLRYRAMTVRVEIRGSGSRIASCEIDGRRTELASIEADGVGRRSVTIILA